MTTKGHPFGYSREVVADPLGCCFPLIAAAPLGELLNCLLVDQRLDCLVEIRLNGSVHFDVVGRQLGYDRQTTVAAVAVVAAVRG